MTLCAPPGALSPIVQAKQRPLQMLVSGRRRQRSSSSNSMVCSLRQQQQQRVLMKARR